MRPIQVQLANPAHRLPWPGVKGAFFPAGATTVDGDDPFWINLLADGSIVPASAPAAQTSQPPAPAPAAAPAAPAVAPAAPAPAPVAAAAAPAAAPSAST